MARLYQRNRSWYLDYHKEGSRHRESLGPISKAEAEAHKKALERRLDNVLPAAGPEFITWANDYTAWHSAEYPDSYYRVEQIIRTHLVPTFAGLAIGMISPREVEAFKHARLESAAPATVSKELRTLQAMINLAVLWDVIPRNPIKRVKAPRNVVSKPPRWYTKEELADLYKQNSYPHIWRLLACTGIRRGELFNLTRRDIGKDEMRIVSLAGARTKSAKWRTIPLSDSAQGALSALKDTNRIAPDVTPYSLSRAFSRDLRRLELGGTLHCLRHTYCSHLVMQGEHLAVVKELAGHSTIKVTEQYAHLAPDHLKGAIVNL